MTGVDRYTVHMTFLVPMGGPTSAHFRFRYRFDLREDLLRWRLDLYHGRDYRLSFFFLSTLRVSRALLSLLQCPSLTLLGSLFFLR